MPFELVLLRINRVRINRSFLTWNDRNLAKISMKLRIKWKFELTVFELTVPNLYIHWEQEIFFVIFDKKALE